jgi:hypothetical protein
MDYVLVHLHCLLCFTEATFEVCLLKGGRGLGLSVTGGVGSGEQWPGLIRIKRLFPHQPASQTGQLSQGDILLAANGVPLIGLTNYVSSFRRLFCCQPQRVNIEEKCN